MLQPSEYGCTTCLENKGSTGVPTPRSNNKCSVTSIDVDVFYAFRCLVFVVQLCVGARCGRAVQMVGWSKGFFGTAWGVFRYKNGGGFGKKVGGWGRNWGVFW